MKVDTRKYFVSKGKNRRIKVYLITLNGEYRFVVATKRLVDFKTRNIVKTEQHYSVETFMLIAEALNMFRTDSDVRDELQEELDKIITHNVRTNLTEELNLIH